MPEDASAAAPAVDASTNAADAADWRPHGYGGYGYRDDNDWRGRRGYGNRGYGGYGYGYRDNGYRSYGYGYGY